VLWLQLYRATDERRREDLEAELALAPAGLARGITATGQRGRRPRDWGTGDDDTIEAEAGLAALAVLRGVTPRR
jgi:hypothetical protein